MERIALTPEFSLSRLVYGMWRLGDDPDHSPGHVQAKIEACLEQGITSFDQADIYGGYTSEAILGEALRAASGLRDKMEIVTKCGINLISDGFPARRVKHYDTSAKHINTSVDASLANMAIDHIDLLLIHRPDPFMDHHETGAALDAMIASGKVGQVGVSNFRPWDWNLLQSAMTNKLVTNQIELSLLETAAFTNGDVAFLQQNNVPPMAWSPLAGGRLFGAGNVSLHEALTDIAKDFGVGADAVAIAWLLQHPARILPVLGTNNLNRIRQIADANKVEIDRETWFALYTKAAGHEVS